MQWVWKLFGWKHKHQGIRTNQSATNGQSGGQEQSNSHIAAAIHRFHQYHQARHEAEDRKARKEQWWIRATAVFAFVAAFATAGAAVFTFFSMNAANRSAKQGYRQAEAAIKANQMSAESGRAWIAPGELRVTQPLTVETGIKARLYYTNPGREPATQVISTGYFGVIPYLDGKDFSSIEFPDFDENSCGRRLDKQATVAFPVMPPNGLGVDVFGTSKTISYFLPHDFLGRQFPFKFQPIQDVFDQKGALVAIFCFSYFTAQKPRLTMVCYFMQPSDKPIASWEWHLCPTGQKAT